MNIEKEPPGTDAETVKDATVIALSSILNPLLELSLDAGLTVQEFNRIAKKQAVSVASRRVKNSTGKESKSRISILTGLPRYDVARTLKESEKSAKANQSIQPSRRILSAWHDDPTFLDATGAPAILPVYGRRRSFERLVMKHGSGLPVRAMLDELILLNAVELIDASHIRVNSRAPVVASFSAKSIESIAKRIKDLLFCLYHNLRSAEFPFFEATAVVSDMDSALLGKIRREIEERGKMFINNATTLLNEAAAERPARYLKSESRGRVAVTLYYFEEMPVSNQDIQGKHSPRKNLSRIRRRKRSPNGVPR